MTPKGQPHPSGRPIRAAVLKKPSAYRVPETEPVVPRLRQDKRDLECVGFVHNFERADDHGE